MQKLIALLVVALSSITLHAQGVWIEENIDPNTGLRTGRIEVNGGTYTIGPEANLSGANLSGANLRGADLSDAALDRANLLEANLSQADMSRANLRRANLIGADLTDTNLSGANLYGALSVQLRHWIER